MGHKDFLGPPLSLLLTILLEFVSLKNVIFLFSIPYNSSNSMSCTFSLIVFHSQVKDTIQALDRQIKWSILNEMDSI